MAGRVEVEDAVAKAEQAAPESIVLDLEKLTFIDSSGLMVLLDAANRAANEGVPLRLTRGKGQPAKLLRLSAVEGALPLTEPCLCPAIHGSDSAPNWMPDDANRPRTVGEFVLGAPKGVA